MTEKRIMNLILTIAFIFLKVLYCKAHYTTTYVEDLCQTNEINVWNLGSASANSSGILKTSKSETFLKGVNCSIIIQPPLGYGVILSVRFLDFRPYYPPNCLSSIQIFENDKSVSLCGYSDDESEYQSYHTNEKAMQLQFNTVDNNGTGFYSDVMFIATSFLKTSYRCEMKMFECLNSRCIWNGLKCDGHNNCGDQSDEYMHGSALCGMTPGVIAGITVGSVMGFLLIILVPFLCCRWRSKVRNSHNQAIQRALMQPNLNYGTDGRRTNIQEAEPQPVASTSDPKYQDLPPAYKP